MIDGNLRRRIITERVAVAVCGAALLLALLPLAHILYTALSIGAGKLTWTFFSQAASGLPYTGSEGGVLNALTGTSVLLFLGSVLAVPLGVVGGMYLADFGNNRLGELVRTLGDTLVGVPSVIWGLFGFQLVASTVSAFGLHWNVSALAGGVILGLIMTPIIARVTELSLRDVPHGFVEASLALGATRWTRCGASACAWRCPGIPTGVAAGADQRPWPDRGAAAHQRLYLQHAPLAA